MMADCITTHSERPWGRMAVHQWPGDEPAFLFLHGNGCAAADWERVRSCMPAPARAWALDFPGHGESAPPRTPYTMGSLAEDALALIEERGLGQLVLVGHSLGGMVAIEVAHRSPDIAALVLVEGWTSSAAWGAFAYRDHHYGGLAADAIAVIETAEVAMRRRIDAPLLEHFSSSLTAFDGTAMLRELAIPVTVLHGSAGRLPGTLSCLGIPEQPNIHLQWVDDAGHFLLHERPADVARACLSTRASI